ncbi:MAG: phage holin [Anaerovoracaceae bacterium]
MPNTKFDAKSFNPEAFAKYMDAMPDVKRNKLLESGAISGNAELKSLFSNQTGSHYGRIPFYGNLDQTEPDNYDGQTDITVDNTVTYEQGVFVYGRSKGWTEKDFSSDITAGVDFMGNIRNKLQKYWYNVDQDTLLAVLGIVAAPTTVGAVDSAQALEYAAPEDGKLKATYIEDRRDLEDK